MSKYTEDEDELRQIKNGDHHFIQNSYFKRKEAFIAFLISIYRCEPRLAHEVYSEAYARFWKAIKNEQLTIPLRASLQTYLNTVGKNLFSDRHFSKFKKNEQHMENCPVVVAAWVEVKQDGKAKAKLVQLLMEKIDDNCQKLLEMAFIKEYDRKALLEILKLEKLSTLRRRIHRCLEKMRKFMKEPGLKEFMD